MRKGTRLDSTVEYKGDRVRKREQQISAGKRIKKDRANKLICLFCALACIFLVVVIMIDAVIPKKYDVKVGQIATENIIAAKDVVDTYNYDAKKDAASKSVSNIYKVDDQISLDVTRNISANFDKILDIRKQANDQRDEWLVSNPGSTVNDHNFDTNYIDMLISNLNIKCNNDELLVLINTNIQDIESICAAIVREVSATLENGVVTEDVVAQRSKILSVITSDTGAFASTSKTLRAVAGRIIEKEFKANYYVDEEATEAARREAENMVDIADYKYKKGSVLVVEGGRITAAHIQMMNSLGMIDDGSVDVGLFIGIGFMVLIVLALVVLYIVVYEPKMLAQPKKVLMLCILIVLNVLYSAIVFKFKPELAQIAIGTILIAVLLKPRVALVVNMAISIILGLLAGQSSEFTATQSVTAVVISLVTGTAAIFMCQGPMHRMRIMATGLVIGGVGSVTTVFLGLIFSSDLPEVLVSAIWPLLGGLISAVLCVGTLPIWETVFSILTPTKLLEITNPNQPLLRRLAIEAPGTHHHSLVVANLAEAGAQAIGADTMLVRAGAYYHDVGKLASPEAFTENQNEKQKGFHSMLLPGESAAIIKAHPTEGNELAEKNKLPKEIRDIILQHHGTTVVGYFYAKALEMFDKVNKSDFAYPGPKPQSKETAILMLADSCEAAVRSLPDKSPENVRAKIDGIIKDRLNDGQFDECDITLLELNRIAAEFTQALSGVHHNRIEYPDLKKAIEENKEKEISDGNRADK